jgi:exodeoxyribonuclease V beta subunit
MNDAAVAAPHALVAARFPLWGSRLIEASAGTGKTWTIAALYLRLVLGHGSSETRYTRPLNPSEILVMTFTTAATRELSDRIRARLIEAARCMRGESAVHPDDEFLQELLNDYPHGAPRQQAAWRLAMAAEGMDDAGVHTIDAWCQRMLREHAFDSGCLFDETLVADEARLLQQAAQDYWRSECYALPLPALGLVLAVWKDIPTLQQDVTQLLRFGADNDAPHATDPRSLQHVIAHWTDELAPLLRERQHHIAAMADWLQRELGERRSHWNGNMMKDASVQKWLALLRQWAQADPPCALPELGTGLTRLTPQGLRAARTKAAPADFLLPDAFAWFEHLAQQLTQRPLAPRLRQHAAGRVAQRLALLKRQTSTFGFADMLQRLHAALSGTHGRRLRERMLAQYPVAMIDEFQDTSPLQYRIFDQVYQAQANTREQALLLIGDPKQSIYGFRGADIYSYLQARQATQGRHYVLQVNYRSTEALVAAVNHCFLQAETRRAAGAFLFRQVGHGDVTPLPFVEVQARGRSEQLCTRAGPMAPLTLVQDPQLQTGAHIRRQFAERCAEQIVDWLNDPEAGFEGNDAAPARLCPKDIAILVRTGKEAAAMRRALQRRGVASVYLSDKDSVFQSQEAADLVHWLRGVAQPLDAALVRAALAVPSLGLDLAALAQLASDDEAFEARSAQFRELHTVWQSQGVLAMLRQTLHRFALAAAWMRQGEGERRLTNFLHLAELLQTASHTLEGEPALVRWLRQQLDDNAERGDEQVIRLESDADLVKIVTVHKSKGLEYPLVCLPFATSFREISRQFTKSLSLPDAQGQRQLVLDLSDQDLERADLERLREDLRLLYVALTRARHALWVGFASVRVGNGQTCQNHKSAIGYLLGGQSMEPAGWTATLELLAQQCSGIVLQTANDNTPCSTLQTRADTTPLRAPVPYLAAFDRDWGIASYSRITRDTKTQTPALAPLQTLRAADDEWLEPGDPAPAPPTPATAPAAAPLPIWHSFQRGPLSGNFLHDQLEWLATEGFAEATQEDTARRLQQRCERAGHVEQAAALTAWLQAVVQTALPGPDAALVDLMAPRAELEFWLPTEALDTRKVDAICHTHLLPGVPRPALQSSLLHGMLMGFADLVFEHQGRYWVLDYKSNHLGNDDACYGPPALAAAMAAHRYDVQAAIYTLALHRLLQSRLGAAYDPQRQLGGAVYLFLRGIHGPAHGCCVLQPSLSALNALDTMLGSPVSAP